MALPRKPGDVLRILVAHSRPLVRKGIEAALSAHADFAVVSAVGNVAMAVKYIRRHRPDVSVIEYGLPDVGGLHIVATVMRDGLATKVLLLADGCVGGDVYRATTAGASGYITTHEPIEDFYQAIRRTGSGQRAFSSMSLEALQEYLLQQTLTRDKGTIPTTSHSLLTEREVQVFRCMSRGISIAETGRTLHISESTVKNHRHSIFAKMGVSNAPAAVSLGMRLGLLPADCTTDR